MPLDFKHLPCQLINFGKSSGYIMHQDGAQSAGATLMQSAPLLHQSCAFLKPTGFFDTLCICVDERACMKPNHLDEIGTKINEFLADSPARDIEKKFRAVAQSVAGKLDLVPREEFDVQQAVLLKTREMVEALEARVAALEKQLQQPG